MSLPKEVTEIFVNEKYHQFATSSINGAPNISNVGAKYLRDDGKIVIVDNFMKKTIANIKENPEVAILIRRERNLTKLRYWSLSYQWC